MLQSLLNGLEVSQTELLEALLASDGDVQAAAAFLKEEGTSSAQSKGNRKRKRTASLTNWLQKPPSTPRPTTSSSSKSQSKKPSKKVKVDDLSDIEIDTAATPKPVKPPTPLTAAKILSGPNLASPPTPSPSKPIRLITDVLRPPTPSKPTLPKLPPLTLGTAALVAQHTPCTLQSSILPPELACRLFYKLLDEANAHWRRNKWFLVDRLVESPHLTSFYVRDHKSTEWDESAQYWYNGTVTTKPPAFPAELEEACRYVESVVNAELSKRKRNALEWGASSGWKANVAAANCYKGAREGVGFHSDQLTCKWSSYLGPYPTIASLSLGTERTFRLRETIPKEDQETRSARTFNISLPHNSLIIMHAGCQEHFKHTIPIIPGAGIDAFKPAFPNHPSAPVATYSERINVTFRFYRPDFAPSTTPRCKCNVPMTLRAQQKARGRLSVESGDAEMRYLWQCNGGTQNDGKGCGMTKVLDMKAEGRGPTLGDVYRGAEPEPLS
ncbi:hypothetical protein M407DRAFT_72209 [Tulasnella calospora MUT 4182]|uniref:Fe2OG dioxygenase domain-containing protein n=1 Tax=Tulasnella calospora MUT 4182 TaxID=1051891 RepID=A0A0C3QMQ0_9AGAM|nr:hypothetical protein M407DRAFT_72209 [Tulasnella calospora MUT 4182]